MSKNETDAEYNARFRGAFGISPNTRATSSAEFMAERSPARRRPLPLSAATIANCTPTIARIPVVELKRGIDWRVLLISGLIAGVLFVALPYFLVA